MEILAAPGKHRLRTQHRLLDKVITCPACKGMSPGGLYRVNEHTFYSLPPSYCAECKGTGSVRWVKPGDPRAGTITEEAPA